MNDLVSRFKQVKDKMENYYRQSLELKAKKSAVEEQIASAISELRALGIEPSQLKDKITALESDIEQSISAIEDKITKAESALGEK